MQVSPGPNARHSKVLARSTRTPPGDLVAVHEQHRLADRYDRERRLEAAPRLADHEPPRARGRGCGSIGSRKTATGPGAEAEIRPTTRESPCAQASAVQRTAASGSRDDTPSYRHPAGEPYCGIWVGSIQNTSSGGRRGRRSSSRNEAVLLLVAAYEPRGDRGGF